jgi:alkylated DNA repair protein (DNA oxidative demethylase)
MSASLFDITEKRGPPKDNLGKGAAILNGFALEAEGELIAGIRKCVEDAPFRHMITPGGFRMSVALTNCGTLGWTTDRSGYHYRYVDPKSGLPWPPMPAAFLQLATAAAEAAGFPLFHPDACLVNRYEPGAKLTLHQDKNEKDFDQPIVSVSLGLPATFLFGGMERSDKTIRIPVTHGDVVVWGGSARLRYHGVAPLKEGTDSVLGNYRYNLTFRRAG